MRKLLVLIATVALLVAATTALAATKTVKVGDNYFSPKTLTVTKDTTVKWRWVGRNPHTVVVTKGPVKFNSKVLRNGATYSKKMTRRGTYSIICSIHSDEQKMKLVVK